MSLKSWDIDLAHSNIGFTVRHLVVSKVRGRFNKWAGSLRFDAEQPERSSVEVQIDAASVDTGEPQRDAHLRSADFFDVERFPHLTFRSSEVKRVADGVFSAAGELTLHGVTQPVVLEVEYGGSLKDPWGKQRAGFTASATLNRKDFGVSFNQVLDTGGLGLGDKVTISIDIEATQSAEVQAPSEVAAPAA